ncbi:IclR family transcriptional regulator [Nocardioides ochotonae]|uniref:IclR family transcriptional regulator n=1 Tax=Nocardioides ochotonae TaxID=2685869 RepID=UPI00174CFAA7|nr:IclR family transcriptional regulator [Nocardioides ochotonae]
MTVVLEPAPDLAGRPPSMVERMTLIMDAFGGSKSRLLLEEIVERSGLPRSTAHRILEQLIRLHWVEHDRVGYRLGRRIHEWGAREHAHSDLRAAASPWLHDLALRTDLVVHLAVLSGPEIEYLDKIGGRRVMAVASRVGGRAPAHSTSLGKAILAWLPPEQVDRFYADGFPPSVGGAPSSVLELHQELARVRHAGGVARESDECVTGVACVGAAVRGPAGPVGAISLVGSSDMRLDRLVPLVRDTAQRIARDMFGERC